MARAASVCAPQAIRPASVREHRSTLKLDGVDVRTRHNVAIDGNSCGPTIMLVHGFGCDQTLWRLVADRLKDDHQLVLIDLIGAGASDPGAWDRGKYSSLTGHAADILDILDQLDLRDVMFVGHSVSAMIGALASITDPRRFSKLVLLTPSPRYLNDDHYHGGFSQKDIDELLDSLDQNYLGWSQAMAPVMMGRPDRPELARELADAFCRTDPEHARVFARTTFLSDNRADLPLVSLPTLVIECSTDAIAPREVGAYVHSAIPGSRLVTLDATGHCPHVSAPDETAAAIAAFVRDE